MVRRFSCAQQPNEATYILIYQPPKSTVLQSPCQHILERYYKTEKTTEAQITSEINAVKNQCKK